MIDDNSRRQFLQALAIAGPSMLMAKKLLAQIPATLIPGIGPYSDEWLPVGMRARFVDNVNGLRVHVLETGYETPNRRVLLLLHGFPELAYSWRKVMVPLAEAGYHVLAPDLRGYGRTTGWSSDYDTDLTPFRMLNKVRDAIGLISAFGYRYVDGVIGHDFGSPMAAWCAVTRPDIFRSVVMMRAPFGGTPSIAFDTISNPTLEPNTPYRLAARTAVEWAKMPTYYIMNLNESMAETVARVMPTTSEINANTWLTEAELVIYVAEYGRTSFQGGLNSYRMGTSGIGNAEMQLYAGKTIDQPSMFISGASDWGTYQNPGSFERMQERACTDMRSVHLVEGAGHWVQQEQASETSRLLLAFLDSLA